MQRSIYNFFKISLIVSILFAVLWTVVQNVTTTKTDDENKNRSSSGSISVAELVRKSGFLAEEHLVITDDGYILKLVRVLNPLINEGKTGCIKKRPILFVPGEGATGAMFIIGSFPEKVKPKDYSLLDTSTVSLNCLIELLKEDPNSRSLAYLASSFGHEVWLLNRRGTPESLGHISHNKQPAYYETANNQQDTTKACNKSEENNPTEVLKHIFTKYQSSRIVNPSYWNYSLDEQVKFDIPSSIDYVLKITSSEKLALVGHSTGAALPMMMLSTYPEMEQKISNSLFWSPSIYQSHATAASKLKNDAIEPALSNYTGPFPISTKLSDVQCLVTRVCEEKFGAKACGSSSSNSNDNKSNQQYGNDEYIETAMSNLNQTGRPGSSKQTEQLVQHRHKGGKMYAYDFGSKEKNFEQYGQVEVPLYDVSKINSTSISFWIGAQDTTVVPKDFENLVGDLKGEELDLVCCWRSIKILSVAR